MLKYLFILSVEFAVRRDWIFPRVKLHMLVVIILEVMNINTAKN